MVRRVAVALALVALALPLAESSSAARLESRPAGEPVMAATSSWRWFWRGTAYSLTFGQPPSFTLECSFYLGEGPTEVDLAGNWHQLVSNGTSGLNFEGDMVGYPVCGQLRAGVGDGYGVVRGNMWYLHDTPFTTPIHGPDHVFAYGRAGDVPLLGDWNGDGIETPGVRRGSTFYLRDSLSGGSANRIATFGRVTDIPVVGDWDGDGRDTIGVVRNAVWYLTDTLGPSGNRTPFRYGLPSDRPVVTGGYPTSFVGVVRAT